MAESSERKELFLIREFKGEGGKIVRNWTRVGAGFVNQDGSVNLRIDEGMVLMHGHNYQLRSPRAEGNDGPQMDGVLEARPGKGGTR